MTEVEINGETRMVSASTLNELLKELDLADAVVATAVNASFVPGEKREGFTISQGDRIEILAPMQGG